MGKKTDKTVILVKRQTAVGTPAAPTGGDAMLVSNVSSDPVSAEWVERNNNKGHFGNNQQLAASVHQELDFEVEVAGSGAAGTAPAWGALLTACGFTETITADTDVKYTPHSEDPVRLTVWYFLDGILHKMTDGIATVSFDLTAGGIPKMKFHIVGVDGGVIDQLMPSGVSFAKFMDPQIVGGAATPAWSLHGTSGVLAALTLDIAATISYRMLVGAQGPQLSGRAPTGSITFELESVAKKDWWADVRGAVLAPLSFTHGNKPGGIVQFDAPKVQLSALKYADDKGNARITANLSLLPNVGNDELVITVK